MLLLRRCRLKPIELDPVLDLVSPSARWLRALQRVHTIMDPTDITGAIIGRATIGHIMDRLTGGHPLIMAGLMPITEARTDTGATDTGTTGAIAGDPTLEAPEGRSQKGRSQIEILR
ncbi:MAG: hypothetical protein NTAFB05_14210 [Nitrobacter sp.]